MFSGSLQANVRIGEIAQHWFLTEPLLFSVYCTHVVTENRMMSIPLRSGNGRIEYNPTLIDSMDDRELRDRLKVEVLRILLKHPYQRQPHRARLGIVYLASSITILDNMGGVGAFCFELVPERIIELLPKGLTFEEYYVLLNRLLVPESSDSDSDSESNDEECLEDTTLQEEGAALWLEDSLMAADINLIIQQIMAGGVKGWGSLPGNFIEVVKASLVAHVNMANLLRGFKRSIISKKRYLTRMRPSRRYGFEQMGSRYAYTTSLLVALDVSGSVSSDMLSAMLGIINRIFRQGVEKVDVLQFDACLLGEPLPIRKAINTFKVLGRGGTNFQPAANYYIEHREYDGLIYITDGRAFQPVIPKEYSRLPVVWIVVRDNLIPSIKHGWNMIT